MKLIRLELNNFCQHEHKVINLSRGLMGILGANGSGKSNLINGIIYAITGTLPNNLAQYVKRGSTGACYVRLTFQSDLTDMTYVIKRGIQPRRAELTCVDTEETIRKAKDIDAFLIDTLKLDFNIIKNVLTVSQEDFVSFFKATPSVRAEILTRLFGFVELKTARESLRQLLVSTKDDSENEVKLKAHMELLSETEAALEPLKEVEKPAALLSQINSLSAKLDEMRKLVNLYKTRTYFDHQRVVLTEKLEQGQSKLDELGVEQSSIKELEDSIKELRELIAYRENALQLGDKLMELGSETLEYQQSFLRAHTALEETEKPLESNEEYEELIKRLHIVGDKLKALEKCSETGCCPTCGRDFPELAQTLQAVQEEYISLKNQCDNSSLVRGNYELAKSEERDAKKDYKTHYDWLKSQVDSWTDNYAASKLTETVRKLPEITVSLQEWTSELYAQLSSLVEDLKFNQTTFQKYEEQLRPLKVHQEVYSGLKLGQSICRSQLEELEKNYPVISEDSISEEEAQAEIERCEQEIKVLQGSLEVAYHAAILRGRITDITQKISAIEKLVKKDKEKVHYREVVSEVCEMLQTDKFPKHVMIGLLEMLTGNINYYLTTFNAPFTVMIDNNSTELYCEFKNGETFLASELSGGQKMVLAISWRLALHNTFATEESCGFLTLDEPTNHLDEQNIQNLTQVMEQVKQAARDKNLQVLVITHEKALEPLFDSVIRL